MMNSEAVSDTMIDMRRIIGIIILIIGCLQCGATYAWKNHDLTKIDTKVWYEKRTVQTAPIELSQYNIKSIFAYIQNLIPTRDISFAVVLQGNMSGQQLTIPAISETISLDELLKKIFEKQVTVKIMPHLIVICIGRSEQCSSESFTKYTSLPQIALYADKYMNLPDLLQELTKLNIELSDSAHEALAQNNQFAELPGLFYWFNREGTAKLQDFLSAFSLKIGLSLRQEGEKIIFEAMTKDEIRHKSYEILLAVQKGSLHLNEDHMEWFLRYIDITRPMLIKASLLDISAYNLRYIMATLGLSGFSDELQPLISYAKECSESIVNKTLTRKSYNAKCYNFIPAALDMLYLTMNDQAKHEIVSIASILSRADTKEIPMYLSQLGQYYLQAMRRLLQMTNLNKIKNIHMDEFIKLSGTEMLSKIKEAISKNSYPPNLYSRIMDTVKINDATLTLFRPVVVLDRMDLWFAHESAKKTSYYFSGIHLEGGGPHFVWTKGSNVRIGWGESWIEEAPNSNSAKDLSLSELMRDQDHDHLTDLFEIHAGTNYLNSDSDGDHIPDSEDTTPLNADSADNDEKTSLLQSYLLGQISPFSSVKLNTAGLGNGAIILNIDFVFQGTIAMPYGWIFIKDVHYYNSRKQTSQNNQFEYGLPQRWFGSIRFEGWKYSANCSTQSASEELLFFKRGSQWVSWEKSKQISILE